MRFLLCFLIINVLTAAVHAQSKLSYTASIEAGLLKGSNDHSSAFLFSNGIRYKNMTAGIGAGIDNYLFRSVPLFLDVKKEFSHHRIQPFVNASAGININAPKDDQKIAYNWYDDTQFKNGFFAKAAAGVSVKLAGSLRVFLSGGYNYKTTRVTYGSYYTNPGVPPNKNTDIYRQNRWYLAAGFCF